MEGGLELQAASFKPQVKQTMWNLSRVKALQLAASSFFSPFLVIWRPIFGAKVYRSFGDQHARDNQKLVQQFYPHSSLQQGIT